MVLETCCCFVISIVTVMGHDNAARGGCRVSHYLVAAGKGRRSPLLSMLCYTCVELALGLLNGCILFDVSVLCHLYLIPLSLSSLSLSQTTSTGFGSNGGGGGGWGSDAGGEVTQKFESMTFSAKGGRGGFGRNSNDLSLSPHAHSPISFGYFLHVIFFYFVCSCHFC